MKAKIALAHGLLMVGLTAYAGPNVFFALDTSGSMHYTLPQIIKSIQEKAAVIAAKDGGMGVITTKGCGAANTTYLVPMAKNNDKEVIKAVGTITAGGAEDLVHLLNFAKEKIDAMILKNGECANVVLFTDDQDTCNGGKKHLDILKGIAERCDEKKQDFRVDVITTAVDDETKLYLDEIAKVGGGKVHNAVTVDEIGETLGRIVEGYQKKNTSTPLASTQKKPDGPGGSTAPATPAPAKQEKTLPAKQGGTKEEKQK